MKNIYKILGITALIAVIGIMFTGCPEEPEETKKFTVTFNSNGGSFVEPVKGIEEGTAAGILTTPTRPGYTFGGWFIDKDVWEEEFTSSTPVMTDIIVYAKWTQFISSVNDTTANDEATLGLIGTSAVSNDTNVAISEIAADKIEITSIAEGTVIITVSDGTHNALINVTVSETGEITIGTIIKYEPIVIDLEGTITITPSENVTIGTELTAAYTGNETVTYQWKKDGVNVGTGSETFTPDEAGVYTVTVSAEGYGSKTSEAVEITDPSLLDLSGTISIAPSGSVIPGTELHAVYTEDEDVSYQWRKDGINVGTDSDTFVPKEIGSYTVTVSAEGYNSITSNLVTVAMGELLGTITISPSGIVIPGTELTAIYTGEEDVSYQWKKGGTNVGADSDIFIAAEIGEYTVTVSMEGYDSITSDAVTVAIGELSGTITIEPSENVTTGMELTAIYSGDEAVSYQWKKDETNVGTNSDTFTPTEAGKYTVTVSLEGYESKTSDDVTVQAAYTIIYYANGASGEVPASQTDVAGSLVSVAGQEGLTYTGKTFGGWNTSLDGTGIFYPADYSITLDSDISLYAQWVSGKTVTFNYGYGSSNFIVPVGSDGTIILPTPPDKSGNNTFNWTILVTRTVRTGNTGNISTTRGSRVVGNSGNSVVADNIFKTTSQSINMGNFSNLHTVTPNTPYIVYANWTPIFTVNFESNGGTDFEAINGITTGETIDLPTPTKANAVFTGWNTKADGTGISYSTEEPYTVTGDITLYAQWLDGITFNDGNKNLKVLIDNDGKIVLPTPDNRPGYTLVDWYINVTIKSSSNSSNSTRTIGVSGDVITADDIFKTIKTTNSIGNVTSTNTANEPYIVYAKWQETPEITIVNDCSDMIGGTISVTTTTTTGRPIISSVNNITDIRITKVTVSSSGFALQSYTPLNPININGDYTFKANINPSDNVTINITYSAIGSRVLTGTVSKRFAAGSITPTGDNTINLDITWF